MDGHRQSTRRLAQSDLNPRWVAMLVAVTLIGFVLRIWDLDTLPPAPDPDELSIGYNAWSILQTGRDEFGIAYPSAFRAFGEYKRPAFIYATVPAIAAFGPTTWAIRLPGAIAGTLTIPLLFAVGQTLFNHRVVALLAATSLAVSPWHLQFSRGAREAAFITLAVTLLGLCLTRGFRSRETSHRVGWFLGAGCATLLAVYAYPGGIVFTPLMIGSWIWVWRGRVRQSLLPGLFAIALVGVATLPLATQFLDGRIGARFAQASLLNDETLRSTATRRIARDVEVGVPWVLDLPAVLAARTALDAYISHFNPTFLFTSGDAQPRHHGLDTGQLYLWDAPLIFAGIVTLWRRRHLPAYACLGFWVLVGPAPASLAVEAPHAVRTIVMLPAWYLTSGIGAVAIWRRLRGWPGWVIAGPIVCSARALAITYVALLIPTVTYYVEVTRRYYATEYSSYWLDGLLEGFQEAQALVDRGEYQRVVIPTHIDASYLYALWATRYDPARYLSFGGTGQRDRSRDAPLRFDPYELRLVQWGEEPVDPSTLYAFVVIDGRRPPTRAKVIREIRDHAGDIRVILLTLNA